MLRKFFLAMFIVGIIFCSQIKNFEKAEAKDVFAYSEGGIEYYISGHRTLNPLIGAFGSVVKGVSGGKVVKTLYFVFNPKNEVWFYQIQDWTGGMARSYVIEQGYLSNSGKAQTVYNVTKNNLKILYQPDGEQEKIRKQQAEEKKAVSLDDELEAGHKVIEGLGLIDKGEYQEAIKKFTEAIKLDPNDDSAYYWRGNVYEKLKNNEKATSDYNKAIEICNKRIKLHPDFALGYYSRGKVYEALKNNEKAISDYKKAIEIYNKKIELSPNSSGLYSDRGDVYAKLKNYEKAILDYTKAIELKPDESVLYYRRGKCYKALGENEKAEADFAKS